MLQACLYFYFKNSKTNIGGLVLTSLCIQMQMNFSIGYELKINNNHTLTQTHGLISICFKTSVAKAIKTSNCVNTLSMAANIGDFLTFIAICGQKV